MPAKSSTHLKALHHASGKGLSLKTFIRELDTEEAKNWFANKKEVDQRKAHSDSQMRKGPEKEKMRQAKKSTT